MKTLRIPKCPKTATGKHWFNHGRAYKPELYLYSIKFCMACGLVDDRKKTI